MSGHSKRPMPTNPFAGAMDSLKRSQSKEENGAKGDSSIGEEPVAKKPLFSFRPSRLGAVADELWEHRKEEANLVKHPDSSSSPGKNLKNCTFISGNKEKMLSDDGDSKSGNLASSACSGNQRPSCYIFGKNIGNRVISEPSEKPTTNGKSKEEDDHGEVEEGFSDLASKAESTPEKSNPETSTSATSTVSNSDEDSKSKLMESAASFEKEAKAHQPVVKEVAIITGEEGENNLIHSNCKLYVFDLETKSWHERGQGTIRINEKEVQGSDLPETRLVMRVQGSLRVVLNSKMWPEMLVERLTPKKLKISAFDPETEEVLLYLINAASQDTDRMENILTSRLKALNQQKKCD